MNDKLKKMARIGYAAKGFVYLIVGVLTFLAAFNMGGKKAGKFQVLKFLDHQTLGGVLLILMAIWILCYAAWRFIQSIKNPENISNDTKGKVTRAGYFVSGLIYLGFAVLAIMHLLSSGSSTSAGGSGGSGQKTSFFASDIGLIVLGIIGLIIIIRGIRQFIKVYKKSYIAQFDIKTMHDEKKRQTIKDSANLGLGARGVMFLIIGYFALKAALTADPNKMKTTADAFDFLQDSTAGVWLLAIVAAGFVAYAVYMFMVAKYRSFDC